MPVNFWSDFHKVSSENLLSEWPSVSAGVSVQMCACADGDAEYLGYYNDVGFMGAYHVMLHWVVFGMLITQIIFTWVPINSVLSLA